LENAFSLNPNLNPIISPNISSISLREQYNQMRVCRQNFSESNIQYPNSEPYKIILDDVIKYFFKNQKNIT